MDLQLIKDDLRFIVEGWKNESILGPDKVLVVGCSTSEVAGEPIGTSGSEAIAEEIFKALTELKGETGVELAFQCCEHLNRAIVIEKETQERIRIPQVNAVPVREAGGAMATHAYHEMNDPVVVETIEADFGMDIGDTLIGMHLKPVVVPLRIPKRTLGEAHVTYAFTRPKMIGGARAVYDERLKK